MTSSGVFLMFDAFVEALDAEHNEQCDLRLLG